MVRVWLRLAAPYAYALALTAGAILTWLAAPSTTWRFLGCLLWVLAAGWFGMYRHERAKRRRIARLIARQAVERHRVIETVDGRVTRLLTPREFADAYWMN